MDAMNAMDAMDAKGPQGEELSIDTAWFGTEAPRRVLVHSSGHEETAARNADLNQRAEHGVGFQPFGLGSFLKSEVLVIVRLKYTESSTRVVMENH